jgi:hypothetical protein
MAGDGLRHVQEWMPRKSIAVTCWHAPLAPAQLEAVCKLDTWGRKPVGSQLRTDTRTAPALAKGTKPPSQVTRKLLCNNEFARSARVAKLADAPDLGSGGETHGGSSPPFRTKSAELQNPALICVVPNFLRPHLPDVLRLRASLGYSKQRREKPAQSRRPANGYIAGCRAARHSVKIRPDGWPARSSN